MQSGRNILISIVYYLAFAIAGIVGFFVNPSFFGQAMLVNLSAMALLGIIYLVCCEVLDEDGILCIVVKVIKNLLWIGAMVFCTLITYTGYADQCMSDVTAKCTFSQALVHAVVFLPLVFILLRGMIYSFTLENLEETGLLVMTLITPVICYALTVLMLMLSVIWSFVVLAVLWLFIQIILKGGMNGFERFLYNLAYYGAFFLIALNLINTSRFAFCSCMAYACCFFFFISMDLFKEFDVPRWIFNVIGFIGVGACTIVGLTVLDIGLYPGLTASLSCGFSDALRIAVYFTPIVSACIRIPLYKLYMESDLEDGLTDAFTSIILPIVGYVLSVLFLLISFIVPLIIVTVGFIIAFVIMFRNDSYPEVPDVGVEIRESVSPYIRSITIIDRS